MRSLKELFQVMLNNQNTFFAEMYSWIKVLYSSNIISKEEFTILHCYITLTPSPLEGHYTQPGNIELRLRWINNQLIMLESAKDFDKWTLFLGGLCGWWANVSTYDSICISLRSAVLAYIHANKPFQGLNEGYWWKAYKIEPRKKWLTHHIKLLNKQINVLYKI